MSEIVNKMQQEIINRSNKFEEQTKGTKDEYNIYREHIQYVYKYVVLLSKDKNVDHEVLELSALLHDIAMTDRTLDRSNHNEYGAEIAEQLLRDNNYPEDKVQFVKKCILNHSSKREEYRTTEEERILVNADGLSHFDSINNLYSLAHNVMELNDEATVRFIKDKLTRDYNEISNELKYLIQDKYDKVMNANSINEILGSENMIKKIDKMNPVFNSLEFQKDKYKFYIALKIRENAKSIIYSNENDYIIMQMNENLPIWVWTKDGIKDSLVAEIMKIIDLYFNKHSKITCKKEFYELLLQNNININEEKSFEMGTLHCEKTIMPKNIRGKMELANISNLDTLSKYWYDDYVEMEDDNYSLEQATIDMKQMIEEGNFYILKDKNDKIVSMARYTKVNDVASINRVYTPIEERKKGYCANLIYNLSNKLLNDGIIPMLYTDYNYIPSNKSYMNVGYVKDGRLVSFYLNEED